MCLSLLADTLFLFYLLGTVNRMFFATDAEKMLRHSTVSNGGWVIVTIFLLSLRVELKKQERCNASLADFTAVGTIPIPALLARLGLLLDVPMETLDKVLVNYGLPTLKQKVRYSLITVTSGTPPTPKNVTRWF